MATIDKLFESALALDEEKRAELAALLIESVEGSGEDGVDDASRKEIDRRMLEMDAGTGGAGFLGRGEGEVVPGLKRLS